MPTKKLIGLNNEGAYEPIGFGKVVHTFSIPKVDWELDSKGWICDKKNGKRVIVLTNHGKPYEATIKELETEEKKFRNITEEIATARLLATTKPPKE